MRFLPVELVVRQNVMSELYKRIELPKLKKKLGVLFFLQSCIRCGLNKSTLKSFNSIFEPPIPFFSDGSLNPDYFAGFVREFELKKQDDFSAPIIFPEHVGKNFILLGNGPSLRSFKFGQINSDVITIGMNYSNQVYPASYHIFSSLTAFLLECQKIDLKKTRLLMAGWLWNSSTKSALFNNLDGDVIPFSSNKVQLISSTNVGEIAIDIAIKMGAKNILLVGYDGYSDDISIANNQSQKKKYVYEKFYGGTGAFGKLIRDRDSALAARIRFRQDFYRNKGVKVGLFNSLNYRNLELYRMEEINELFFH